MIKQILLITDGCSNVGIDPVVAAAQAKEEQIIVNVVGVLDQGDIGEMGAQEIKQIAHAGGGMSSIVSTHQLAQTVQMMTRKTVMGTIQHVVHKELKKSFGTEHLQQLPIDKRAKAVEVMENMTESIPIQVALLIDSSASMKSKLPSVKEAIADLCISLQSRMGEGKLCVFHYPGLNRVDDVKLSLDWTDQVQHVYPLFNKLSMRGTTPTGPAILHVIDYMISSNHITAPALKGGQIQIEDSIS
ncbi:hypothetical protein [Longirhabdus pacifica]|uniref:hypothetical protein n=1 Tax=Longirhabdus pacifica TaxID=2305227 RepID=UPI001F0C64B1|nr:hypothetical protein [Longirhabdus pacifica]